MRSILPLLLAPLLATACGDDDRRIVGDATFERGTTQDSAGGLPGVDECGDVRLATRVFFGTPGPSEMPLNDGQILAIGTLGGCTGTFVTDEWILTAEHCGVRPGARFCVGPDQSSAVGCFTIDEVRTHPQVDMSLIHSSQRASEVLPQLEPITVMDIALDDTWIGRTVEAAGFGGQEDGTSGEREFTAQPLVAFEGANLVIDGMGERGVCFGDSGGPVMGLADDGTVRVLGDLSFGDPSCTGRDRYARTDLVIEWIEDIIGPVTPPAGGGCGNIDSVGQCSGQTAVFCDGDTLARQSCEQCGWSDADGGFRCIAAGTDPCEGESEAGSCDGNVASWCDNGVLRTRDCGACGEVCGDVPDVGGAYCQEDACGGIDFLGECQGDVAVWCDDGNLRQRDCARVGASCGFVNDQIGFFCVR